jgi:hypothetical protein
MTATATPATVAPRMGMVSGVLRPRPSSTRPSLGADLRGAGARIGTDEDLPSEFQRKILAARDGETAAQTITNSVLLDLAITEHEVTEVRQLLLDMTVQRDAMRAELVAAGPVLDVVARDVHRGTASGDLWGAYTTYTEGGTR